MISLLIWIGLIYIAVVVIWRLIVSIMMIIQMYAEDGIGGAILAAVLSFVINVWDLAKFALSIIIIAFLIKACS
ncbi:hypothetical protein EDS67_18655 [candidate division KSB1 bacterium]|nr:MAG: hypothetical protein EDS67_18655 [candidate division KSB1 bacterium]MBC6950851.1 hypothetical protein [candidate division KSB1 bacterium]MCE7944530.1 hypothetical protein [Chlorobi bacterium CHB1]MDL1876828.1 hypothetical protein [Cytophagia bacterium CHB2]